MKNLIISPHIDDEVISCSSVLRDDTYVFFCGVEDFHIITKKERKLEALKVSTYFGYDYEIWHGVPNSYNRRHFIDVFQKLILKIKPEKLYIPYYGYNQDHQEIYEAAMVATRPHDKNFFVKKILAFEGPDCLWCRPEYKITYYVPLNIEDKITGYRLHVSQVRSFRGEDILLSLAKLRGLGCNQKYAEGFITERWVD